MKPQLSEQLLEATPLDETQFDSILRSLAAIYSGASPVAAIVVPGGPLDRPAPRPASAQIELRAYHLYLHRGATHGQDLADWLQAERELDEAAFAAN